MGMTSPALQSQLSLQLGAETTLGQDAAWTTPSKELGDKAHPAALGAVPAALTAPPFFEGGPHASWGQLDALTWESGKESQFLVGGRSLLGTSAEAREPGAVWPR